MASKSKAGKKTKSKATGKAPSKKVSKGVGKKKPKGKGTDEKVPKGKKTEEKGNKSKNPDEKGPKKKKTSKSDKTSDASGKKSKSTEQKSTTLVDDGTLYSRLAINFQNANKISLVIVGILYIIMFILCLVLLTIIVLKIYGYVKVIKHFTIPNESARSYFYGPSLQEFNDELGKFVNRIDFLILFIIVIAIVIIIMEVLTYRFELMRIFALCWIISPVIAGMLIYASYIAAYTLEKDAKKITYKLLLNYFFTLDCYHIDTHYAKCLKIVNATTHLNESSVIGMAFYKWKCCGYDAYSDAKYLTTLKYWPYWCCSGYGIPFNLQTFKASEVCQVAKRNELCIDVWRRIAQPPWLFQLYRILLIVIGLIIIIAFLIILVNVYKAIRSTSAPDETKPKPVKPVKPKK